MKEKTKYWVISDTHFGHEKMLSLAGRPYGFETKILANCVRMINEGDVLIHLGDFCIGNDRSWHEIFHGQIKCKKWLIRGNHDRQTDTWYLNHGWDFVAESMTIKRYGHTILFTHIPVDILDSECEVNVHGHLHGDDHRHDDCDTNPDFNTLIAMENEYRPFDLRKVVGK